MNVPIDYYRALIQAVRGPYQIQTDYDASGNETYSGVAEARALTTDPIWAVGKAVYTPTVVSGTTVNLLTHWSFLTGVAWDSRGSLSFP
jgi:hypothetical protein